VSSNKTDICVVVTEGVYWLSALHVTYTSDTSGTVDKMSLIKIYFCLTDCKLGFNWLVKHKADEPS